MKSEYQVAGNKFLPVTCYLIQKMLTLTDVLKGGVCILCVGNIDRGDDGIGPRLAEKIKGKTPYEVIDAGVSPENWTGVITRLKPDTIIIVDAVHFEGRPGDVKIFAGEDLRSGKVSTHDVSPKLVIEYLKESINADIYVLGIKPGSVELSDHMSPGVKTSLDNLAQILTSV